MSQISYTFLRNNHTKQGRISTWTREQPGATRKEKMMGDYTEHLISMAGGDGEPDALDLDAIQARVDAADGPWEARAESPSMNGGNWSFRREGRPGIIISAHIYGHGAGIAEFIANAPQDMRTLLAVVRSQQAAIERVKALIEKPLASADKRHYKDDFNRGHVAGYNAAARLLRAALTATEGKA